MNCRCYQGKRLDSLFFKAIVFQKHQQNDHAQNNANSIYTQIPQFLAAVFQERKESVVRLLSLIFGEVLTLLFALDVTNERRYEDQGKK